VSHTPTCHLDGHADAEGAELELRTAAPEGTPSRAASVLDPTPSRIAVRAARVTSLLGLPEVRWAALSLAAFLLALLSGALGAPEPVQ
jgi:hypothetical protein